MLSSLAPHANKLKYLLNENSTTILTAAGVAGTVATAYFTGRATFKAAEIIANEEGQDPVYLSKTEKFKLVWPQYLPPVAVGVLTVTSIIFAHKISSKKIAALTIAGGISERAFQEYKDKVVEKLGVRQDQKVRDEIAQERVNATPMSSGEVLIAGSGEVLCFDMLTGRYFMSTMEDIKRAENKVNYELIHFDSCSLTHFYDEIGLPPTVYSDSVGWNLNNNIEVKFSTVFSNDNKPCIAIDFSRHPMPDYDKTWT